MDLVRYLPSLTSPYLQWHLTDIPVSPRSELVPHPRTKLQRRALHHQSIRRRTRPLRPSDERHGTQAVDGG